MKSFKLLLVLLTLPLATLLAGPGDTTIVQAFTFGGPQDAVIAFPDGNTAYQRVLMYYTLRCIPGGAGGLPYPCGEWDYLTYTNLYHPTGQMDSTLLSHPNFKIGQQTPATYSYTYTPLYNLYQQEQYYMWVDNIISQNTSMSELGNTQLHAGFGASNQHSRAQYLWKASDLITAGVTPGNIHRLCVEVSAMGSNMKNFAIRMRHTTLDSLDAANPVTTGFTTHYFRDEAFTALSWKTFDLHTPFNWNGTSNVIIEFLYDNSTPGTDNLVNCHVTPYTSGLVADSDDQYLSFKGADYVNLLDNALFSNISDKITVSFWLYGDQVQPQDEYAFEGMDANGYRVINCHLPWSNGRVYWDAGNSGTGSYDRIDKQATVAEYKGQWNHWTFEKDANLGVMRIYLNGALWHSGTAKTKLMDGVEKFKLCVGWSGNSLSYYDGMMDEFQVWNEVLDLNTVNAWRHKTIDPSHPYYNNLMLYYPFNEGNGLIAYDASGHNGNGELMGLPQWKAHKGANKFKNFRASNYRPNMAFMQGVYVTHLDTLITVDSVLADIVSVELFNHPTQPATPTDTMYVWPSGYGYTYSPNGTIVDSTLYTPDGLLTRVDRNYYSAPFEVIERYEIGRYITPYGINLNLGNDGVTWIFDVTDYLPILRDSARLTAGNWQEWLDLKFLFIEGTPSREVKSITNIYQGNYNYVNSQPGNPNNIENQLTERTAFIPADAASAKLKVRTTGHGFGGNLNCAEFCPRNNNIKIDGVQRFTQYLWRDNCPLNPVFPQGGTWPTPRANWCPGAEVTTDEYELTPFITPGDSIDIDYNMQANYNWNGQGSTPYYGIETQLVTYGPANFTNDARIEEIIAPNTMKIYKRLNPICGQPVIKIRNTGSAPLTSLTITYGIAGLQMATYNWTGNLPFEQVEEVTLPPFMNGAPWQNVGDNTFIVSLSNPNGVADENPSNDEGKSNYALAPVYLNNENYMLLFKTNSAATESSYTLEDDLGNVLYSRNYTQNNTFNRDTFILQTGCYNLTIHDSDDDGISYWANNDGSGFAYFYRLGGPQLYSFPVDFGRAASLRFSVDLTVGTIEPITETPKFDVFPNPTQGEFTVLAHTLHDDAILRVFDLTGKILFQNILPASMESATFDLSNYPAGTYAVSFMVHGKSEVKMVQKN